MLSLFNPFKNSHLILFILFIICGNIFAQWDKYPTYDEYLAMMSQFETSYPNLCKIEEIGESVQGRKLLAVKVSDNVAEDEEEPGLLYISTIHGDEVCGYVLMLHLIDSLLTGYTISDRIKKLVDSVEIWICPLANPDGTYHSGNHTVSGAWRYNANHVDLDRNFPFVTGTVPTPEEETKAIIELLSTHNFTMAATLHSGGEMAMYPWAYDSKNHADKNWFEYVTQEYAVNAQTNSPDGYFEDMGGYCNHYYWYQTNGTLLDYATYFAHCRTIHIELSHQKLLNQSELLNHWNYNFKSFLNYMEQVFHGFKGYVAAMVSGHPIKAKVFIENHDIDNSYIYSKLPSGDFYRPAYHGVFTIHYSSPDFLIADPILHKIQLRENELIKLNIKIYDIMGGYPSVALASPYGGEVWERGKSYNVIWYYGEANYVQIIKDSTIVETISLPAATKDAYLWNIPSDYPIGNDYRIRVSNSTFAISGSTFSIIDQVTPIENPAIKPITHDVHLTVSHSYGNTSIRFNLPYSAYVKLEAYDIKGKLVKVIQDKFMHKGSYSVNLYSIGIVSGVYFLKLSTNSSTIFKRAFFVK